MPTLPADPETLRRTGGPVDGVSAVLLPHHPSGNVDWESFHQLLRRTLTAGLTPAVNMDTGFGNLLDDATRREVLAVTRAETGGGRFVAGAFVIDRPGDPFAMDSYATRIEEIESAGGTPVVCQSFGLAHQADDVVVANYRAIAERCDRFIAFELGDCFAPFGRIYSLELYRELMTIPQCLGAKHSSLRRQPEWDRLALRDAERPDFRVYTGNDLAIDMIAYGSDYLLGLSCFAPDAFAKRDGLWAAGDARWVELNDVIQHLGFLAFRDPVPAYKHSAAMFLQARGWIPHDATHPQSPPRGDADSELLTQLVTSLDEALERAS